MRYMKNGFTLIELMIAITIISVLVSLGLSAYGKARERQIGVAAGETIISILQENQSIASTGKKDCEGKYLGQEVVISTPNTITARSTCEGNDGPVKTTNIPGITIETGTTLIFSPLSKGIEISSGGALFTLSYASSANLDYQIQITTAGTVEYLGVQ
jgi:prepilin-type N-terminal cleavage/methylation domain-containing protein